MIARRNILAAGLTLPSLLALAACGPNADRGGDGSASGGSDAGGGSLRLAWWGNPTRNDLTDQVLSLYAEQGADVTVSPEPGEWNGYWDKLATQIAAGDMPDIVQMDEIYLSEFGSRGALLDLEEEGLDITNIDPAALDVGRVPDAGLVAITAGLNAACVLVNTALFDEHGVTLPDDATWTWDDYLALSEELWNASGKTVFGSGQLSTNPAMFRLWMRQAGADLYTDGKVGFDEATAVSFFEWAGALGASESTPSPSETTEDRAASVDQQLMGTGRQGLTVDWSNRSVQFDAVNDGAMSLLRPATPTGTVSELQLWNKASMYWVIAATSAAPDTALDLVDFLVNDVEAGKLLGVERGVPANTEVRAAIAPELPEADRKALDYLDLIVPDLGAPAEITPMGATEFESILTRAGEGMMFGSSTPAQAGKAMFADLSAALGG